MAASRFDDIIDSLKRLQQEIPDSLSLKGIKQDIGNTVRNINSPLLIMVMGEFSTGKSTFINALVGQDVAKVDAKPTTAVITKLVYGASDQITVIFRDGSRKNYDPDNFAKLTAETDDEANDLHEKMDYIERAMPIGILKSMSIIDSPGLNSIKAVHEETTRRFMDNADTVIWLFDAHNPGRQTEIDALKRLNPRLSPLVLVNKIDTIDEDEGDSIEQVITGIERTLRNNKLEAQRIVGVSAKMAMQGQKKNNEKLVEASRIADFYTAIEEVVLPRREEYKRNSLLDGLARIVFRVGSAVSEESAKAEALRDTDYTKCMEIQMALAATNDELENVSTVFVDELEDQKSTLLGARKKLKLNAAEKAFFGVLYWLGLCVEKDEKTAQQYMEQAAVRNDATAQMNLAEMYRKLEQKDKAEYWFERLGIKRKEDTPIAGSTKSISSLINTSSISSKSYSGKRGYGLELIGEFDIESSRISTSSSGKYGYGLELINEYNEAITPFDLYNLGINAQKQNDFITAMSYYQKSVDAGNNDAKARIQEIQAQIEAKEKKAKQSEEIYARYIECKSEYLHSYDESKFNEMMKWCRKAADEGNPNAMYALGGWYQSKKFITEALNWYKKAADGGNADALVEIGKIYEFSIHDEKEALEWYRKAADAGNKDAKRYIRAIETHKIDDMYKKGNQYYDNEQYSEALAWYRKAADKGHVAAMNDIGYLYENGKGVPRDYKKALEWYRKADKAGDIRAIVSIDRLNKKLDQTTSSTGCYITTAVCNTLQKPDDCYELTMFRNFRDGWLKAQPDGEGLIQDYYAIAPAIVANIDARRDAQETYFAIWKDYLSPCLTMLENGRNAECKSMYTRMVLDLKKRFIP